MIVYTGLGLKLVRITDRGNYHQERVHLEVTRDFDTSFYILIATMAISDERVFAGGRPAFWFESQQVKAGDNVVVYTRGGAYSKVARQDGHFNHFFFWGMPQTLFGDPLARIVIAELNSWDMSG